MILLAAFAIVLLSVPLSGGRLQQLSSLQVRWVSSVMVTLVAQAFMILVIPDLFSMQVMAMLHLATYFPAVIFVWANRHIRGLGLLGLGGGLNFAAIATNGGVMPSSPAAAAAAGHMPTGAFINSAPTTDAPLWFLGDVFVWPEPLPLANVFSVGDLLLVIGAAVVLHIACRPKNAIAVAAGWGWSSSLDETAPESADADAVDADAVEASTPDAGSVDEPARQGELTTA